MTPKALILLPLLVPLTVAWGSSHDLYIRDAVPELDYERALAARALAARKAYAAKARRSASPQQKVLLSRQINARSHKARTNVQPHAFQQYDAGLFSRDGSVIPRDPYAYPTAVAQPDPETWFEGGELWARMQKDDEDEVEDKPRRKASTKARKGRQGSRSQKNKSRKGKKASKTIDEEEDAKEEKDDKSHKDDKEDKESREKSGKSWFSWFKW